MADAEPLRWGILGAARIAAKALIPALRRAGAEVRAVAASSADRAQAFARAHGLPRAYAGYDRLLADPDIEAVYLPLANGLHARWAVEAARAGKHCLCEKPLALSAPDAEAMTQAFALAKLRLMEAFMWRHHAQALWLRDQVRAGRLGRLERIDATFAFTLDRSGDYRWSRSQGGGALWDVGCYAANAARYFFDAEPLAVAARGHFTPGPDGVDAAAAGWLDFGQGRLAVLSCSFRASFCQGLELLGTEGRAWTAKPWLQTDEPTRLLIEQDDRRSFQEFPAMNSYVEMVRRFTRAARDPAASLEPGEDGRAQTAVMERLLQSAQEGGRPRGLDDAA